MSFFASALWQSAFLVTLDTLPLYFGPKNPSSKGHKTSVPYEYYPKSLPVVLGALCWWCAPESTSPLVVGIVLRRLTSRFLASHWPSWLGLTNAKHSQNTQSAGKTKSTKSWLQTLVYGPLGAGASKLVHSVVGIGLYFSWRIFQPTYSTHSHRLLHYCTLLNQGSLWNTITSPWWMPLIVGVGVTTVNAVLWLWSTWQQSRGNHPGVQDMVSGTTHRALTVQEHVQLLGWALVNAACEEVVFRGLVRGELYALCYDVGLPSPRQHAITNVVQASIFGIGHYYGIPSGWTGVGLTLVYGGLMGLLADTGHGLFWPIVAHCLADYYIFAAIARRKLKD